MQRRIKISIFTALFVLLNVMIPLLTTTVIAETSVEIQERQDIAEAKALLEWIDEEGYLVENFYIGKSFKQLEDMGVHKLIRNISESEVNLRAAHLKSGISSRAVTAFVDMIQEGWDITGYFEVDGHVAYCVQHSVPTPGLGSPDYLLKVIMIMSARYYTMVHME